MTDLVVCSFYTTDDYYAKAADRLREDLEKLGVATVLKPMEKAPGEDWSDICRKKVPFLNEVCVSHPGARVVWVDVDCRLLALPDTVRQSSADIVGFARGFSSALKIGYQHRTRFWEPCFWGVGPSPNARRMIADAAELERTSTLKATDDFFFEEAWRANADRMTFQILPSGGALGKGDGTTEAFLIFGASGSVAEFKGKVAQHQSTSQRSKGGAKTTVRSVRTRVYRRVKETVLSAPDPVVEFAVELGQRSGITAWLKPDVALPGGGGRGKAINSILQAGINGDPARIQSFVDSLSDGLLSQSDRYTIEAARTFADYATTAPDGTSLSLKWWARPFPGNFGDWLSPYIVSSVADRSVKYVAPTSPLTSAHLVGIGSIGKYIDRNSIVVGTGVSAEDAKLSTSATYVSLRGPLTAEVLRAQGGPKVTVFGDPGAAIERLFPVARTETNGKLVLVRHFIHRQLPVRVPDDIEELSVLGGSRASVESLLTRLNQFDGVITSAMHIMIACHSYGIPCALVTFDGFEDAVHGDGMKYRDYALGVGIDPISPQSVVLDLGSFDVRSTLNEIRIGEDVKDGILSSLGTAIDLLPS